MDTRIPRSLRDFIELARRKSAESRSELFGNIADLFLNDELRLSDRERALMTGILHSLIASVESSLLRELSNLLTAQGDAPDALEPILTRKTPDVARPILMRSRAMRAPELVELIKFRCREHQLAIAMRPSLAAKSADPTATGADEDLIEALLRDGDTPLARQASEYLVAESERIDRLKLPLLALADLPADIARRLHWCVAAALRVHMVDGLSVSPAAIDGPIETATRAAVEKQPAIGMAMAEQARQLIDQLAHSEPLTVDVLTRLLQSGRVPAFVAGLAQIGRIPWPVAQRIVLRPDGQSLAILCKASGIDGDGLLALHALISSVPAGSARLPADERNPILAFYDKITKGNARAALDFWRRDPDFIRAMEQVNPVAEDSPSDQ